MNRQKRIKKTKKTLESFIKLQCRALKNAADSIALAKKLEVDIKILKKALEKGEQENE